MKRQMGKAVSIMVMMEAAEIFMHEDVGAFHAPSECHALVSRGESTRRRQARRKAKSVSGLSRRQFNTVLKQVGYRAFERAVSDCLARMYPVGY